jgi:hypothetical protein
MYCGEKMEGEKVVTEQNTIEEDAEVQARGGYALRMGRDQRRAWQTIDERWETRPDR